jgi:hypothetical protein
MLGWMLISSKDGGLLGQSSLGLSLRLLPFNQAEVPKY